MASLHRQPGILLLVHMVFYCWCISTLDYFSWISKPCSNATRSAHAAITLARVIEFGFMSCLYISRKSFRASSFRPLCTYPTIIALHDSTFHSGIFLKSFRASSTCPSCAYPVIIVVQETRFLSGLFSNSLEASSECPF